MTTRARACPRIFAPPGTTTTIPAPRRLRKISREQRGRPAGERDTPPRPILWRSLLRRGVDRLLVDVNSIRPGGYSDRRSVLNAAGQDRLRELVLNVLLNHPLQGP